MTYHPPSSEGLAFLERRREGIRASAETMLLDAQRTRGSASPLTRPERERLDAMQRDLREVDSELATYKRDLERSQIPERFANLGHGEHRGWVFAALD